MENPLTLSDNLLEKINEPGNIALGITGSPSTTLEVVIDITEQTKTDRALGQMVYVVLEEDGRNVLVIGQIIEIETKNRWHEDPAFKGVIKRHGSLPHLSGAADNRIATISVQACYDLGQDDPEGYILGTSPSTGVKVFKMNNPVMSALMTQHEKAVTYMGRVYGTNVNLPFWFKHFDRTDLVNEEFGAGDAYHIGVFGKTGSGKTVTASLMLLGYSKNKNNISILVLDPQSQFYLDKDLLPSGMSLKSEIEKNMTYKSYRILEDISLPGDNIDLFADLLLSNGFVQQAFRHYNVEKMKLTAEAISSYLTGRTNSPGFSLNTIPDKVALLKEMLTRFVTPNTKEAKEGFSRYVLDIYGTKDSRQKIVRKMEEVLKTIDTDANLKSKWVSTLDLFDTTKPDGTSKLPIDKLVDMVVAENGNFIVLDIGQKKGEIENENLQARFVTLIENAIVEAGAECYATGKKGNCLIVMDEAHRYISSDSPDPRVKELTRDIIGAVRTTRKYGIGYMFITQTIESLDDEIIRQMRIFGFGYGLTSGPELRKTGEVINNSAALQLYKSFIDPSSNGKFPFMFFGPISPLSFTGSPLFIEVYKDFGDYR
ncbi:MAG: ATP-binding protein [Pyrinomonadaceae bacterium]